MRSESEFRSYSWEFKYGFPQRWLLTLDLKTKGNRISYRPLHKPLVHR